MLTIENEFRTICLYCGKEIPAKIRQWNRNYCSLECRDDYHALRAKTVVEERKKIWKRFEAEINKNADKSLAKKLKLIRGEK